ncbi:MAG: hypothetical protein HYT49_01295 [Candidatus Wildermuthbacteria bacterium]|nr:hypothetical protein [Candidatus Wildermuthbacteria bacterium]
MKKKFALTLVAFVAVAAGVAGLSAFEAHVINVTAQIENALQVPTDSIDFGTVFPQEELSQEVSVSLSSSFLDENRVDDVDYFIRQKPKCAVTTDNGTVLVDLPTATGHIDPETGEVDCGEAPAGFEEETMDWGVLPSLCEYISKHPDGNPTPSNDGSLNSFHTPWVVGSGSIDWTDTPGRLAKSENDTEDTWTIDLAVPCFGGNCAQDWLDFVRRVSGDETMTQEEADAFTRPIADEHKIFGCDLWIEVNGVSETPEPGPVRETVGADLSSYVAPDPSQCDVTVHSGESIATAVAGASQNNTVCVEAGTYNETVPIEIVGLSLVGASPVTTTINGGVIINADGVTVTGFKVIPGNTEGSVAGFYLKEAADNARISFNDIDGTGIVVGDPRGILNVIGTDIGGVLIDNNFIHDLTTGIYTNPHTGSLWTISNNDIDDNLAGIGQWNGANVLNNEFEHTAAGSEAIGVDNAWDANGGVANFNNFLNGTMINQYGVIAGTINAENNFFSTGAVVAVNGSSIDASPEEGSAFPHN